MSLGDRIAALANKINQYIDFLYPIYVPTYTPKYYTYTFDDIYNIVMTEQNGIGRPDWWVALDNKYWVTTLDDLREIVSRDWTRHRRYISERFDCDNFALHFAARMNVMYGLNSCGIVVDYTSAHAYNLCVVADGNLRKVIVEPQTGQILLSPDNDLHQLKDWTLIL